MRSLCLVLLTALLASGPAGAQDAPRPLLGRPDADPTGCDRTPEAIRRLYAECNSRPAAPEPVRPPPQYNPSPYNPRREMRTAEPAFDQHCRSIVARAQLGEGLSDADRSYLRTNCRARP